MNFSLDPESMLRCQRWEDLQNEAEQFRRHRQLSQESHSHAPRARRRWRRPQ